MQKYKSIIYEKAFETAVDAIIIINSQGLIQYFNQSALKMFGYTQDEVIDKNISMLMPEPYNSEHDAHLKKYLKTGKKHIIGIGRNVCAKRKNNEVFPISLAVSEIKIENKVFFAGTIRDITEQLKNEKTLIDQRNKSLNLSKQLESFSYSVSHDLSAPLRHIIGYAELLKKELGNFKNASIKKYFNVIKNEALRMDELIKALLSFSRLGREALHIEPVDFNQLIPEVISFFEPEISNRKIRWEIAKLPLINCDKKTLKVVWENLISNALKFTQNNQQTIIKIYHLQEDDYTKFIIEDNGVGFNPSYTDELFKVFKRLHANKDFKGNGIGLVNIKQVIEKHGGKVWIEGEENQGAKVFFTLPNQTKKEEK